MYYVEWLLLQSFDYLPAQSKFQESFGYNCSQEEKKITNESQRKLLIECNVYYVFYHAHAVGPRGHGLFFSVLDQYWLQELNFQELLNRLYKKTNNMKS